MALPLSLEPNALGTAPAPDAEGTGASTAAIPVQVHRVTFTAGDVGQAVETLLSVLTGRQMVQWPEQVIIAPGPGFTMSEHRIVRVESQYSIADGQTVYALSVLTVAGGGQA